MDRGTIGRFRVVGHLGAGGMGVVLRAHDAELDREVALKMLHVSGGADQRARLIREAQTLARLSHPNVLQVFDVVVVDDQVALALEFVDGEPLDRWLDAPRSLAEILDAFAQAAAGLQAVHDAGLVHRDFKPANALVSRSGRVKVMDFGLARAVEAVRTPESDDRLGTDEGHDPIAQSLTATGTVMGTPSFMSPEQHTGEIATPACDQFALCVSLYAAVYGQRPYDGRSLRELYDAKCRGPKEPPPSKVPKSVRRAILRGLAPDPEARHASMEDLRRCLRPRRRSTKVVAVTVLGLGAVAAAVAYPKSRPDACVGAAAGIDRTWNDETRSALASAFEITRGPAAWALIEPRLDRHATELSRVQRSLCAATPRAPDHAKMETCARKRELAFAALVGSLATPDRGVLSSATTAAASLPDPADCLDPRRVRDEQLPPADPELRQTLDRFDEDLFRVKALADTGQLEDAGALSSSVLERARALGHAPTLVRALLVEGGLALKVRADVERAEPYLVEAFYAATSNGLTRLVAAAAFDLLDIATKRGDLEAARKWRRHGEAAVERLGAQRERLGARLQLSRGLEALAAHDYEACVDGSSEAIAIEAENGRAQSPWTAAALTNLALCHYNEHDYERAEEITQRALQMWRGLVGDDHPKIADVIENLAMIDNRFKRFDASLKRYERVMEIRTLHDGEVSWQVGKALNNLAIVYEHMGATDKALEHLRRSAEILRQALPDDDPRAAVPMQGMVKNLIDLQRFDEAQEVLRETHEIRARAHGEDSVEVARSLHSMGRIHAMQGQFDEAYPYFVQVESIYRSKLGDAHSNTLGAMRMLAELALDRGQPETSLAILDRHDVHLPSGPDPIHAAQRSTLLRGRVLWALGDRRRGRQLVQRAYDELTSAGSKDAREPKEWLDAHP